MSQVVSNEKNIVDSAWDSVVDGYQWVKSVLLGEFVDNRPISAIIADMLVSFVPGVVIVTSARDAVAVSIRLARHPEKREEVVEWIVLCACLITIALPLALAAAGLAAAGVGAIVGGIAGSELGAALRAVMLLLARGGTKLIEVIQFLQKFIKGNIIGFLRAIKFIQYEKPLVATLKKITDKLIEMCASVRLQIEKALKGFEDSSFSKWAGRHTDMLKNSATVAEAKRAITKLAEWERRFYELQQVALQKIPLALTELDARLAKVLAQAAPKEAHTVSSGVQADKTVAAAPARQVVNDVPGQAIAKADGKAAANGSASNISTPKVSGSPTAKTGTAPGKPKTPKAPKAPKAKDDPLPSPRKDKPDTIKPADTGKNTKKQATADAIAAADKERITILSKEAAEAEQRGNKVLAAAKIEEAREILRPHLPKNPGDS